MNSITLVLKLALLVLLLSVVSLTGGRITINPEARFGNAILLGNRVVPIYPIKNSSQAIGFYINDGWLFAVSETGRPLWSREIGGSTLFGINDFDSDGVRDLALARSEPLGERCGESPVLITWLELIRGKDGSAAAETPRERDRCWTFDDAAYSTAQWYPGAAIFGDSTTLALQPQYATSGFYYTPGPAGSFIKREYAFPSTRWFEQYANAQNTIWNSRRKFIANSSRANGLIVTVEGQERLIFFTSGRVVQYAVDEYSSGQLLFDTPFVSGGRADLAGRNYGLVALDPNFPQQLVLLAGTPVYSVFEDMLSGSVSSDPWGGIERHLAVVQLKNNGVDDRFISYAHDGGDNKYAGRLVYPNTPFITMGSGKPSRIAYNLFDGGQWTLHITKPGSTDDAYQFPGLFLWDIVALGAGCDAELVISSPSNAESHALGEYFLDWGIALHKWDEALGQLKLVAEIPGVIPQLQETFHTAATATQSDLAGLYPVLYVVDDGPKLVVRDRAGAVRLAPSYEQPVKTNNQTDESCTQTQRK